MLPSDPFKAIARPPASPASAVSPALAYSRLSLLTEDVAEVAGMQSKPQPKKPLPKKPQPFQRCPYIVRQSIRRVEGVNTVPSP